MLTFPTERIVRRRPTIVPDPYQPRRPGSPDWSKPQDTPLGCLSFAPVTSRNVNDPDRSATSDEVAFYGSDPSLDVRPGDRLVRPDATVYEVAGHPETWPREPGWPGGIVINAKRVTEGTG
ncbi:hypothetical protein LG274_02675 [Micrococcus antarcticus]|uniref:hypothetical protein n=1 Tax=Micrococcus antarcticus TaxID=86171 RepID=UPI00384B3DF3